MKSLSRRDFVKLGVGGLTAFAVGSVTIPNIFRGSTRLATAAGAAINLVMTDALVEMYDLKRVYMWLFADQVGPKFPGPTILATEGDLLGISLTNDLGEPHAFAVSGTTINSGPIAPGQAATVSFTAPPAGTYIYYDPLNEPVNRVLGLHGVLVSMPQAGNTPYSNPTPRVQQLFNDLGNTPAFPGEGWAPGRTKIWVFHNIDPRWNDLAQVGQPIDPAQFKEEWLSQYFTINGHSGFFASHHPDIVASGFVGQPHLIRIVNTGMNTHSPHIHGNHVFVLSRNGQVQSNVHFVDTDTTGPMDRVDWLLPFIRPPDLPGPKNVPIREAAREELALVDSRYGLPQKPLAYPMHCHAEMSQTAAGGNYPGGLVTHWEIIGDIDGVPF